MGVSWLSSLETLFALVDGPSCVLEGGREESWVGTRDWLPTLELGPGRDKVCWLGIGDWVLLEAETPAFCYVIQNDGPVSMILIHPCGMI